MQSASANFLLLSSVCYTSSGDISTVLACSHTFCYNFSTLVSCAFIPLGRWKILPEFSLVIMKGSPYSTSLDVAPVSLKMDGMVPFMIPITTSASVRWYFYF